MTAFVPSWPRRHPIATAGIAGTIALLVLDHARTGSTTAEDELRYHDRAFTVIRAIDPVTIEIDAPDARQPFTRVRLIGVAPRDASAVPPLERLRALAGTTVTLALPTTRTRDPERRLRAYVLFGEDEQLLNARLIEEGAAIADRRDSHALAHEFARFEERTRHARLNDNRNPAPGAP